MNKEKKSEVPSRFTDNTDVNSDEVAVITYDERGQRTTVRKSNELVQMAMYSLSLSQQKLMLHIFAMIQPTDTELPEYELTIYEFIKLCGIDPHSGHVYDAVRKNIEDIANMKVQWVSVPGTKARQTFRWIDKAEINPETGKMHIWLDRGLKPHLIQLKEFYTTFNIMYTMPMRSQYSVRIYELCKSYQNLYVKRQQEDKQLIWEVEHLRKQIACTYTSWTDIRRYVLDKAKEEINGKTDILFDYEAAETRKRKVVKIAVTIEAVKKADADRALAVIDRKTLVKKKRRTKAQKEIEDSLIVASENESPALTLGYVSAADTTIPYEAGHDKEKLREEIFIRACFDELKTMLSEEELNAVRIVIDAMVSTGTTLKQVADKENRTTKIVVNEKFFGTMNEVILRTGSLKSWFAGIAPKYATDTIPMAKTKGSPLPYLCACINKDLENFRFYTARTKTEEQQKEADIIEANSRELDQLDGQIAFEEKSNPESYPNTFSEDNNILLYEDAATKRSMVAAIQAKMDYERLSASLTKGQKQALDDIIQTAAMFCRRNQKGKDDGMVRGKANIVFIEGLNKVIQEYNTLDLLFSALAHELDYDVFWDEMAANPKIKNARAVFAHKIEDAIRMGVQVVREQQSKEKASKKMKEQKVNPETNPNPNDWTHTFDED